MTAKATTARGAPGAKHAKPAPAKGVQHKSKPGKPADRAVAAKNGPGKPQFKGKQERHAAATASKANGPDATATAAVQITALVNRMSEKGLTWYQAVKPLKVAPQEPQPQAKGKKHAKNKDSKPTATGTALLAAPHKLNEVEVQVKKAYAQKLMEQEVARFEAKKGGKMSSDDKYLATMMSKGTLADRVAALTLTIQSSPFHSLSRLGQLITMASKKARRESMMAVESLKDLFINNLLPDDRKLQFFHQHPLDHAGVTDEHLLVWFFEHCLKTAFAQLVGVLSSGMQDAVDNHKRACIRAANALLAAKPEQEAVFLGMLVNKIGDPDRKVASYIHKTLQELLQEHPLMKRVVVDEVERLLTRAQVSDRTKYNAVLFLNQIMLRKDDEDDAALAGHLIKVFFALFSKEVHTIEEAEKKRKHPQKKKAKAKANKTEAAAMDRKLLSALLVGVNRAFPYAKSATSADLQEEIDTLFKVVRLAHHFPTSVHALMLLFQVMHATNSVSDRFYTALYEKLFDPKLRETSKHTLFLNLVFKAMKADVSPARSSALVKRLLQLTSVMSPAFTCAVLFLLSEVIKIKPQLRSLFDQAEATGGAKEEEHFDDADSANVFNPEEEDDEEDKSSDKDADEEDDDDSPAALSDGLTDSERTAKVLAEMFGDAPSASVAVEKPRAARSFDDDDLPRASTSSKGVASTTGTGTGAYDWQKRNPLFAGAETSCAWEVHHLLCHYHPSVQMFARQLVLNAKSGISYAGDPLVDFTMHSFFEKFMNKKPRHKQKIGGKKVDEDGLPLVAGASGASGAENKGWTFAPINSEAVLREAEENVDASDQFFYKFFKERAARDAANPNKKKKKKVAADERDADAFSDDGDEEEEDEELEAFAQQLAEGIMQDGDLDDEDPEMDDWSGPEDGDDDGDDYDEDNGLAVSDDDNDDDEDDDEGGAFLDGEDDDDDDDEGGFGGDDDDSDDEDGFDFDAMDGELDLPKVAKAAPPPTGKGKNAKRKPLFADADDYETILRDALAKQKSQQEQYRKRKQDGRAQGESDSSKPKTSAKQQPPSKRSNKKQRRQ